jgi:hypothetical protein
LTGNLRFADQQAIQSGSDAKDVAHGFLALMAIQMGMQITHGQPVKSGEKLRRLFKSYFPACIQGRQVKFNAIACAENRGLVRAQKLS